jgi:alpha-glucoside transport system permease protein
MVPVAAERGPRPHAGFGRPPVGRRVRNRLAAAIFLGPAGVLIGAIVIYPAVATVIRSFYDRDGSQFVGLRNYRTLFGATTFLIAIRNNAIWVIVFPFCVTFLGLVFAVLTERIRWATAFKVVVFMPMAISLFATGVIWRIVYETDPHRGALNAAIAVVADTIHPPGPYHDLNAMPTGGLTREPNGDFITNGTVTPGSTLQLGLTAVPPSAVPPYAQPARPPTPTPGAITGVVWRDFSPNGTPGVIEPGELGLPGMHLKLLSSGGSTVRTATTDAAGSFVFEPVGPGDYRVVIDGTNFRPSFHGVEWLGTKSLTPTSHLSETGRALLGVPLVVIAEIVAMLWIWSGFSMVVIGAGLAALNRELLEAARIDGASEWQIFRQITLPLLTPVLIVVIITMIINVLKIFDIILAIAPDSSQQASNVIALEMWRVGFTGTGDFGLSSAVAVILFILVVPVMLFNVRRIRG